MDWSPCSIPSEETLSLDIPISSTCSSLQAQSGSDPNDLAARAESVISPRSIPDFGESEKNATEYEIDLIEARVADVFDHSWG